MPTLLSLQNVHLTRGPQSVLRAVNLGVASGERLALLGRNGAGKTTLLDVLAGRLRSDEGERWEAEGLRLAYLSQHPTFEGSATVARLVADANPHLARAAQLETLAARLDAEPELLPVWAEAQAAFEAEGGYRYEVEAAVTLGVLDLGGFRDREAASLSGGERTRLALALALLQQPDVLLLDEPTNHLDLRMREWLEHALIAFRGAVVLTSHDRELLDRVAQRSLWIEAGEATPYPGGYTRARSQRELERRSLARAHRLTVREEERLSGAAARESRWGRRAAPLRSRAERLDVVEAPLPERRLKMRLLSGDARARVLVWGEKLSKRYGERIVLRPADLKIRQGDRIVLLGANGTGKTTLLRLLAGELYPDGDEAKLQFEAGVTVAYLDQTWHGLKPDGPLRAQFAERFGDGRANALLGRASFTSADWPKTPRQLSGGERARAGLALVGGLRADLLLLDEPTNHLDVEALETLEHALQAYGGASVIVTHDRRFAREVASRLWRIEDGQLQEVAAWGSRETLDPARTLQDDPPPPPPPPSPRERMEALEDRLADLDAALIFGRLTGREEARLRARRHRARHDLGLAYDEIYGAEVYDHEVREGPLWVRGLKLGGVSEGGGGMFWGRGARDCPHLAWSGEVLTWQGGQAERWFARSLLRGALRLLFEHWGVAEVRFGGGSALSRAAYLEGEGLLDEGGL